MKVFCVYTPETSELIRIWERSWRLRGWTPRIISPREFAAKGKRAARGGKLVSVNLINFAFKRGPIRGKRYRARGWEKSPLVLFPFGSTEDIVLNCGRSV